MIAAVLAVTLPGAAIAMDGISLGAMRWEQRRLLIFATPGDARLARQREINAAATGGYVERDIRVVTIAGDAVSGASDTAAALRHRFKVDPHAFAVILIGKDGGEKLRSAEPLPAERLFATIDAMPMRKDEMRR